MDEWYECLLDAPGELTDLLLEMSETGVNSLDLLRWWSDFARGAAAVWGSAVEVRRLEGRTAGVPEGPVFLATTCLRSAGILFSLRRWVLARRLWGRGGRAEEKERKIEEKGRKESSV